MKIKEIEYSYRKNLGNYESTQLTYRAILEDWEDPEESLSVLRDRVGTELNLGEHFLQIRRKLRETSRELRETLQRLEEAQARLKTVQENFDLGEVTTNQTSPNTDRTDCDVDRIPF